MKTLKIALAMMMAAFTWTVGAQGPVPPPLPANVALPDIGYGVQNFMIQSWYQYGNTNRLVAQKVRTNFYQGTVISPTATNAVTMFTLSTNAVVPLRDTNGQVYAFVDVAPAPVIRQAFEIAPMDTNGIFETTTDLVHWYRVGWDPVDPAAGGHRWWRTGTWDTNAAPSNVPDVYSIPLRLRRITITN